MGFREVKRFGGIKQCWSNKGKPDLCRPNLAWEPPHKNRNQTCFSITLFSLNPKYCVILLEIIVYLDWVAFVWIRALKRIYI